MKKKTISFAMIIALILASIAVFPSVFVAKADGQVSYTLDGTLINGAELPGVYKVTARVGDSKEGTNPATIGIPSIAKQTLENQPTQESPAIIMGAAVNYEKKTGPTEYTPIEGKKLVAPYKYFRWSVIDEERKEPDGTISHHKKLSGFDGSYYLVRVDVSDIIKDIENPEGKYLHVRQDDNKALMVAVGFEGTTYANAGSKSGSYSLANNAAALKDNGEFDADKNTPYFDVIILSSGKLAAGADAGSETAPSADIKLGFYVDDVEDYHPELKALDPNNMPTFPYTPEGSTVSYADELAYNNALLTKYYENDQATAAHHSSSYVVKGSDLEIDVTVDEQDEGISTGTPADFWSLTKAMDYQPYDGHIIKLICEVPVLEGLYVEGRTEMVRDVILDVNSFDIQIANNTEKKTAGITIDQNAALRIMDGTGTAGAELAIGNNATMVIKKGGTLIIDESCTAEVEYDAATVPSGEELPDLGIGEITIKEGGILVNWGVMNIEGAESKPKQPNQPGQPEQDQPVVTDMKRADMFVENGGSFYNFGCLSLKGDLYVLGSLYNYGRYNETIDAHDPDKGTTSYHKGIQITWKDVVTDKGVEPGALHVGIDAEGKIEKLAYVENQGDIVLAPGVINLYGEFYNKSYDDPQSPYVGHLYLCTMDEAIIPIIDPNDPLHVEDRVKLDPPKKSLFHSANGTVFAEGGEIASAKVKLLGNGVLGDLTPIAPLTDISTLTASTKAKSYEYTDKAIKPEVVVSGLQPGDYTVTYKDNKKVGTAKARVEGNADKNYTGTIETTFEITKGKQPMTVNTVKKAVSAAKVKKKAQVVSKAIIVKGNKGTVTYTRISKGSSRKLTINKKTGKITVKKGTKPGIYKIVVNVKAQGTVSYKPAAKKVTATIIVK